MLEPNFIFQESPYVEWSLQKKVSFRFIFCFSILFIIIFNNGAYPFEDILFQYPNEIFHELVPWIGKYFFNLPYDIKILNNGSADTTYDYFALMTIAITASVVSVIWSVIEKKKTNYIVLYYWLTTAVRFYLGLMFVHYGLLKIIKLQFPDLSLFRLTQAYGDSSPMGLAWTFLGFSDGYNLFMGIIELTSVLLFFRRTVPIGAVITLMTTVNVMAINFFYDIPVKIISTGLVAMSLFLLSHNIAELFTFFFSSKPTVLTIIKSPLIKQKGLVALKYLFKASVIAYALIFGFTEIISIHKKYGDGAPKPPLYGLYHVNHFIKNGDTIPPLTTDSTRWGKLIIEFAGLARVRHMIDSSTRYRIKLDSIRQKIIFSYRGDTTIKHSFIYEKLNSKKLNLKGTIKGDSVSIFMTQMDSKDFRLIKRGFNWINEQPYNK